MASLVKMSRCLAQSRLSNALSRPQSCRIATNLLASRSTPSLAAIERYYASKAFPEHTIIKMPALSPTMTAGNIGKWNIGVGDSIAPGDVLVEVETDKAQMDFEFQEDGVLAKILKEAGEKDVAVGSPIAVLVEEGADVSQFESFTIEDAGGDKSPPKEAPKEEASQASEPPNDESSPTSPRTAQPSQAEESESTGARLETSLDRAPKISPAAKKLALEKGVPIGSITGSGKGGQITKEDIEKHKPLAASTASTAGYEDIETTSMRKTIASRLVQSMQQNPHYFVQSSMSVSKLLKLRAALNASADGSYKLSVNDFLVKAIALAAIKVPAANSSWREENGRTFIRQHNTADVSVAVATPVGLMTPIVKNAHALGLESISSTIKDLGKRARDGKLSPPEYQGGTITISNMGMNEAVERFTAVINPPQACIVAVGTVKKVAVFDSTVLGEAAEGQENEPSNALVWDDQIVLSGSFDHKVVDGAVAGEFMRELKRIVEDPLKLLL